MLRIFISLLVVDLLDVVTGLQEILFVIVPENLKKLEIDFSSYMYIFCLLPLKVRLDSSLCFTPHSESKGRKTCFSLITYRIWPKLKKRLKQKLLLIKFYIKKVDIIFSLSHIGAELCDDRGAHFKKNISNTRCIHSSHM